MLLNLKDLMKTIKHNCDALTLSDSLVLIQVGKDINIILGRS